MFVIRLVTREVHIAGIIPEPDWPWMNQMACNLTDASEDFLRGCRFLIHDRSTLFTAQFRDILACAGVDSIRLPARSPKSAFLPNLARCAFYCLNRRFPLKCLEITGAV